MSARNGFPGVSSSLYSTIRHGFARLFGHARSAANTILANESLDSQKKRIHFDGDAIGHGRAAAPRSGNATVSTQRPNNDRLADATACRDDNSPCNSGASSNSRAIRNSVRSLTPPTPAIAFIRRRLASTGAADIACRAGRHRVARSAATLETYSHRRRAQGTPCQITQRDTRRKPPPTPQRVRSRYFAPPRKDE